MKVILLIITVMTLVIGASINSMALTLAEQIYAAMFYIMAYCRFVHLPCCLREESTGNAIGFSRNADLKKKPRGTNRYRRKKQPRCWFLKKRRHCLPTGTAVLSNVVVSFASDVKSSALQSFFYGWHKKFGFCSMYQACLFRGRENAVRNG